MPKSEFERVGEQILRLCPKTGLRIGIVRSLFRSVLTEKMQSVVEKRADALGATIIQVTLARGAMETPLLARQLLRQDGVDGVVVLAVVIRGQTRHDDVVVSEATRALIQASFDSGKPVGVGIIGPGVDEKQAEDRVVEYAQGAVDAVVLSTNQLKGRN